MDLKDKKILITGATGGIGNCLVEKFYNFGSSIVASGTNEEKLNNLKKKFPNIHLEKFKLDEHDKIAVADGFSGRVEVFQYLSQKWKENNPEHYKKLKEFEEEI